MTESRERDGLHPRAPGQHVDVDERPGWKRQAKRISRQHDVVAEKAPEHRERPPQRPHRIVGFREEQPAEPLARGRRRGANEIREQAPRLVSARRRNLITAPLDPGRPQQAPLPPWRPTRVERSGDEIPPPRGHKAWGLLTYLVRTPAPSSRERLGGLLFPEADDPMGSLRWTLSVLRRFLGDDVVLAGDPLRLSLPPGTFVDVDVLSRGSWVEAVALPGLGHELLDGMAFPSSPGFENWLENERRYVAGTTAGVLRQAALGRLGYGEPRIAVKHASELVRLEPFDQNAHALLVRCMRAVGDLEGAAQHVSACVELFRAELGVEPTLGLHEETAAAGEHGPRGTRRAAVLAQIETGEAVITAGAVEAGLERLRGAVAAARASSDRELLARSLIALGGALVHGARGTDVEGAAALHEGIALAEDVGADELAATGWREVSWVQFLRAEYDRAETSIGRAAAVAALDEELAWIDLILGSCRNDVGERVAAAGLLGPRSSA